MTYKYNRKRQQHSTILHSIINTISFLLNTIKKSSRTYLYSTNWIQNFLTGLSSLRQKRARGGRGFVFGFVLRTTGLGGLGLAAAAAAAAEAIFVGWAPALSGVGVFSIGGAGEAS